MNPIFWKTIFMKTVLKDYLNWTFNRNFWNGLLNWTMNWFLNMNLDLINSDWTLNTISDMNPLLWTAIMNLWYDSEIHLCYMTFCMIWDLTLSLIPEPFLFPYLWRYHRRVCDAPLAWLVCGPSDLATPSPFWYMICALYDMICYGHYEFCGGVWMHPRSVLFSGFNYDYDYDICLVTGTVCYTCLSQFLGVRYSTHLKNEDTPHIIWLS